jgi:hypothetical protein
VTNEIIFESKESLARFLGFENNLIGHFPPIRLELKPFVLLPVFFEFVQDGQRGGRQRKLEGAQMASVLDESGESDQY